MQDVKIQKKLSKNIYICHAFIDLFYSLLHKINLTKPNTKETMKKLLANRYGSILLLYIIFVIISFITRTVLLGMSFSEVNLGIFDLLRIYGVGLFYDTIAFTYFMIFYVLTSMFISTRFFNSSKNKWIANILIFITIYIFLFNSISEYFFWEEFGVRYNFIAVDYLIYTTEVVGNIRESYPLTFLLSSIFVIDLAIMYFLNKKKIIDVVLSGTEKLKQRLVTGLIILMLPVLSFIIVDYSWAEKTENRYNGELSKNGVEVCVFIPYYKSIKENPSFQQNYDKVLHILATRRKNIVLLWGNYSYIHYRALRQHTAP